MLNNTECTFIPLDSQLTAKVWETQLDRIKIIRVPSAAYGSEVWIRLIGPGFHVNLRLQLPTDSGLRTVVKVTTEPLPNEPELVEYTETSRRCYFADVYVFLRQQGLDQWNVYRPSKGCCYYGLHSWTYTIISRLVSQGAFHLEIPYMRSGPLDCLRKALFPHGSDLRESTSYCPMLNEEESIRRDDEWNKYRTWREMHVAQLCLEDLDIIDENERPGSANDDVDNPRASDSSTLLSRVEADPQARDAMLRRHYSVVDQWYDQILAARK